MMHKSQYGCAVIFTLFFTLLQFSLSFQTFVPGLGKRIITVITFDTLTQNTMYVGTGSDFSSGETGAIFKSTDGGTSWDTLLQNVTVRDIDIHPTNPKIIYASLGINFLTISGIVKTTDGGISWVKADSGVYSDAELGPSQLAIDPLYPETLYVGTSGIWPGKFYRTTNGGTFWETKGDSMYINSTGVTAIGINPESTNVVYVGTNYAGYIMRSSDYGQTWNYTGLKDGLTNIIKFTKNPPSIYIGTKTERRCGFFQSINGGSTWTNPDEGIVDSIFDVHSIEFDGNINNRRIFITGNTHIGKSRIYYKYENDSSWKMMQLDTTGTPFYMFAIRNGKFWLGSFQGLFVLDLPTKVQQKKSFIIPYDIKLYSNYPNPFNGTTRIRFELPSYYYVDLSIVDIQGRTIKKLYEGTLDYGNYEMTWDGTNLNGSGVSSGTYFIVLQSGNNFVTRKILLLK